MIKILLLCAAALAISACATLAPPRLLVVKEFCRAIDKDLRALDGQTTLRATLLREHLFRIGREGQCFPARQSDGNAVR